MFYQQTLVSQIEVKLQIYDILLVCTGEINCPVRKIAKKKTV